jgi:protein-S-isoprenylcysteine O-methyltransferase Ste14
MADPMYTILVLLLAVFHAARESSCFGRSVSDAAPEVLAGAPIDRLWLTGGVSFILFELLVAWHGLSRPRIDLPHAMSAAVGLSIFVLGTNLRCRAIAALAVAFASPPFVGHPTQLATSGVFSLSRHPSELGLLLMSLGLILICGDVEPLLFLVLCLIPLSLLRIYREERWLRSVHGAQHAAYCSAVPLILPDRLSFRTVLKSAPSEGAERANNPTESGRYYP